MHYNVGADLFTYMLNPEVFQVVDGGIPIITAPGLGVEINEELIRKEAEEVSKLDPWINPLFRGEDGGIREW